jgi:hypothetical protein
MTATSFAVSFSNRHIGPMARLHAFFWPLRIAETQLRLWLVSALVVLFLLIGSGAESGVMTCEPSICDCAAKAAAECPAGMTTMCKVAAPLTPVTGNSPLKFCPESAKVVSDLAERIPPSQVSSPDLPPPRAANFLI